MLCRGNQGHRSRASLSANQTPVFKVSLIVNFDDLSLSSVSTDDAKKLIHWRECNGVDLQIRQTKWLSWSCWLLEYGLRYNSQLFVTTALRQYTFCSCSPIFLNWSCSLTTCQSSWWVLKLNYMCWRQQNQFTINVCFAFFPSITGVCVTSLVCSHQPCIAGSMLDGSEIFFYSVSILNHIYFHFIEGE